MRAVAMLLDDVTRVYHRVDALACLTPFMRDLLAARGFERDKLHVTLTPIDFSRVEVSGDDDGTFLYVGRLSREKGIDVLVEAAKRMKSAGSRVIIIGEIDGRYAERCVELAATGGGAKVEFLGPRYGDEMLAYLRRCRATVMPSRCLDNLPNALLESFAAGKPIVGSDYEGITVVVKDGENGLTFEPGNAADLAAKLDALAADPARARQMGLAGRRLVEAKHSPEHHYASLMTAFESAVGRTRK
jgi:glycosyltransferase involved in cell wall biosynthesis